jgi:hypothetical protein
MFVIRSEQLQQLDVMAYSRFYARLIAWLRIHAPAAKEMTNEELLQLIGRQQQRAAAYELTTERDLHRWCYLAVVTEERFDTLPEVQAMLRDPKLGTPSDRLELLMRSLAQAAMARDAGLVR